MKATGIVRKIDDLGRIVIPKELRRNFDLKEGDALEIFVTQSKEIVLKKYSPGCVICGSMNNIKEVKGKKICQDCISKIK